nr:tetratricopeptide repeat protein [Anaerolineae bacterium]
DYWWQRGVSYHEKKDYDRAIADHSKAIELNPNNPDYWWERGNSYRAKGDVARADADLAKARQLGYKG